MELISQDLNIDFLGKARIAITFSVLTIVGSLYIWFHQGLTKYGIDYLGGHELVVKMSSPTDAETIRKALPAEMLAEATIQSFEAGSNDFIIRLGGQQGALLDPKAMRDSVSKALDGVFGKDFQIIKSDFVGPAVGEELRTQALLATAVGIIAILIYVSIRFEFALGLGAVVAIFHDVVVSMGVYLLTDHKISVGTLAAALTIVGYSVNDTIVIFDRVREDILKGKEKDLNKVFNLAINQCLSRTVITHLLTLFSILALLIYGGATIEDLSFYLTVGIVVGTYSTIYIASPVALAWERFQSSRKK